MAQPSKRARTIPIEQPAQSSHQPRLFAPFRALGFISNHVPLSIQTRSVKGGTKPSITIVSCTGNEWAMWDAAKMGLLFVGSSLTSPIASLLTSGDSLYASSSNKIYRYFRGKIVDTLEFPEDHQQRALGQLLMLGSYLLCLSEDGKALGVWDATTSEFQTSLEMPKDFTATTFLHPATYLNKILIGSAQGTLALYNIRTRSLIYSFNPISQSKISPITSLTQSPAIDLVGISTHSGLLLIHDIRTDETLMTLKMTGGISAHSFRMDGKSIVATASPNGSIATWDLENSGKGGGKILHLFENAHSGPITSLQWLPGQSVLVSSSSDNSIKQWIFDTPTSPPRLLKSREGHSGPVGLVRFYGTDGKSLLSAGRTDRSLRCLSLVREARSFELSQSSIIKKSSSVGSKSLKLAPITALSHSMARSKEWEDILTLHADSPTTAHSRTWSLQNKRLGRHAFPSNKEPQNASAVCVSACGNFGLIALQTEVKVWNLQSGGERKKFSVPLGGGKITGLSSDALNRVLVVSTLTGGVHFFDFHNTSLLHTTPLPSSCTSLVLNRENNLVALVCDDFTLRLIDIETYRIVRELGGFKGRILDVAFSPDSRWLVSASVDSVIRTFDVPTGRLVDAFRTTSIPTSLAFSPTADFLVTSHVDTVGVYLWANKALFSEVALGGISDEQVFDAALPSVQGLDEEQTKALEGIERVGEMESGDIYTTPEQLSEELLTLSLMPRSRWQTLLNLETIKQRQKPKEPPKAPEKAPFFLPSLMAADPDQRVGLGEEIAMNGGVKEKTSHRLDYNSVVDNDFTRRLSCENLDGDFNAFFEYMKSLSPSATDLEIRSLISLDHLSMFIHALNQRLSSHRDFEAVQVYLNMFLKIHGDVLVANYELKEGLVELEKRQKLESKRLGDLISYSQGVLAFIRNAPL